MMIVMMMMALYLHAVVGQSCKKTQKIAQALCLALNN